MRNRPMKKRDQLPSHDEPVIISFESVRQANARPDDDPPDPSDGHDPTTDESFWAGRNNAMRRSARWVA